MSQRISNILATATSDGPFGRYASNAVNGVNDEVEFHGGFTAAAAPTITLQPVGITNCLAGIPVTLNAAASVRHRLPINGGSTTV